MRYEVLSHTADTGIIAHGESLAELFENAAYGMFDLMFDLRRATTTATSEIVVDAGDVEDLMFSWLSELLFRAEVESTAWSTFQVELLENRLHAVVGGCRFADLVLRGPPVKAVTMHLLEVAQEPEGWRATVVFDV